MKDHVEIDHLKKYDAFRVNRDQARLKIHTNVSNFESVPQNHYELLKF